MFAPRGRPATVAHRIPTEISQKKPKLDYASPDETRLPEWEGSGRYFRELPDLLWLAVAVIVFAIFSTALVYLRLSRL